MVLNPGPQRGPATVGQIEAQTKQLRSLLMNPGTLKREEGRPKYKPVYPAPLKNRMGNLRDAAERQAKTQR